MRKHTRIYKYLISNGASAISIYKDAEIIHINLQGGSIYFWAIIDENKPLEIRELIIIGTGNIIPENHKYIGTVHDDPFVWHIFEKINKESYENNSQSNRS